MSEGENGAGRTYPSQFQFHASLDCSGVDADLLIAFAQIDRRFTGRSALLWQQREHRAVSSHRLGNRPMLSCKEHQQ